MSEKDIRLDEVAVLENHLNAHGIGNDNPDQPIRRYVKMRRKNIEDQFATPAPVPGKVTKAKPPYTK